ncbi:MAG: trypsin-like peptidase domain-containing protein [Deltaproteobacteria bacterium]|nr:trypsin-like peptidase domain-containing protein [Deltaproteobacteria bacterium]
MRDDLRSAVLAVVAVVAAGAVSCSELGDEMARLGREARNNLGLKPKGDGLPLPPAPPGFDIEYETRGDPVEFNPPLSFAPIYKAVAPSVVNISAISTMGRGMGEALRLFYESFGVEIPYERFLRSRGTGFVVDQAGRVVTNWRIVEGTDEIAVVYMDESERPAKLEFWDAASDLALLVVGRPLPHPPLELSDSDTIETGEWVLAIGNAIGLGHTATAGIVSARRELIQIDASINEGNCGGPLLDMSGRVVGVNVKLDDGDGRPAGRNLPGWSETSQGIGFAIPAARLREFLAKRNSIPSSTPSLSCQPSGCTSAVVP